MVIFFVCSSEGGDERMNTVMAKGRKAESVLGVLGD